MAAARPKAFVLMVSILGRKEEKASMCGRQEELSGVKKRVAPRTTRTSTLVIGQARHDFCVGLLGFA